MYNRKLTSVGVRTEREKHHGRIISRHEENTIIVI